MIIFNKPETIHDPEDAYKYLKDFRYKNKEYFILLGVDTKHQIRFRHIVSIGCLNAAIVHPREVFRPAIAYEDGIAAIIVAHNHCSGCVQPSREDLNSTSRLAECGEILGIELLDHLIVSKEEELSIRQYGWPR